MYAHGDVPPTETLEGQDRHNFPRKLYELLQHASPSVVSWLSDGMSFCVLDERAFAEEVIPQYFAHSKMASFQRQLNIYGFRRLIAKGNAACAFFHPCFVRGHPELLSSIRRVPKKRLQAADDGRAPGAKINTTTFDLVAATLQSSRSFTLARPAQQPQTSRIERPHSSVQSASSLLLAQPQRPSAEARM